MLNPVHLATLRAVVASGSFSEAARRLGYTPSAVSQQIGGLERSLGVKLFERTPSSAQPTPAALLMAQESDAILDRLRGLEVQVRRLAGTAPTLRLGSFTTASRHLLPQALAGAFVAHGGVDVRTVEGNGDLLLPLLTAGELDVAIVYRYSGVPVNWPSDLVVCELLEEPMMVLMRADATSQRAMFDRDGLAGLSAESWITLEESQGHHRALVAACRTAGFEPRIALEVHGTDVLPPLVAAGIGLAIISALGLQEHADVIARPLPDSARQVYAVRRDRPDELVDRLVHELRIAADDWRSRARPDGPVTKSGATDRTR